MTNEEYHKDLWELYVSIDEANRNSTVKERYKAQHQIIRKSLHDLRLYQTLLERMITQEQQIELADMKRKYPPEEHEEYWYNCYPTHWENIVARNFRMSLVATSISILEYCLHKICSDAEWISKSPIGWKDAKSTSSNFDKFETYLSNVIGFTKPKQRVWNNLKKIYKVRNKIAHSFGIINDVDKLKRDIGKLPGIEILTEYDGFADPPIHNEVLHVFPSFNDFVVDNIEAMLEGHCLEMARLCEKFETGNK